MQITNLKLYNMQFGKYLGMFNLISYKSLIWYSPLTLINSMLGYSASRLNVCVNSALLL